MTRTATFATALLVGLLGCSKLNKGTLVGGGDQGPLGDTMADAVRYERGATITAPVECHTSGYAKLAIPAGEALQLDVSVTSPGAEACVGIGYLKDNGGAAGISDEVCSGAARSFEVTTPPGGDSFLQVAENGVCQGATITIAIR